MVFAFKYIGANCGSRLKTKGKMLFKMMLSVVETGQLPGFREPDKQVFIFLCSSKRRNCR